jgi:3D (Asp-Asp-Asp) domain-containing protein
MFVLVARVITVIATSYCLHGTMADGTYTRSGSAANNFLPLGTKITTSLPFMGIRHWVVRDRIGWGTQLDLWAPTCRNSFIFGRRRIQITLGWH